MSLPDITLPPIDLAFVIPTMLHPLINHFLVALPIVILLIEIGNIFMKKRAVSGITYFLLFLVLIAATAEYLILQNTVASEHKTLGTYIMLGTVLLITFKFIFMFSHKIVTKLLYLLILGFFIFAVLVYDKENGQSVKSTNALTTAKAVIISEKQAPVVEKIKKVTIESIPSKPTNTIVPSTNNTITSSVQPLINEVKNSSGKLLENVVSEVKGTGNELLDIVKEKVNSVVNSNTIEPTPSNTIETIQ